MLCEDHASKDQFNPGDKSRVTRIGKFLRKTKIDELPELINVLKGDMSIIGPRPEVARYIQVYPEDFRVVLKIRPGLSDYASVKYRDEEEILATQQDPESHYLQVILPDKLRLAKVYAEKVSFTVDLDIMKKTLRGILGKFR
jgi:lipopolysaccharide/colanic/teichoic acid biosynthesis glycosyltransferase